MELKVKKTVEKRIEQIGKTTEEIGKEDRGLVSDIIFYVLFLVKCYTNVKYILLTVWGIQHATSRAEENEEEDVSKDHYGSYGIIQSAERKKLDFIDVKDVLGNLEGQEVGYVIDLILYVKLSAVRFLHFIICSYIN